MKSCRPMVAVAASVFLLAGCSSEDFSLSNLGDRLGITDLIEAEPETPTLALPPAPPPIYAAGDTFVYSDDGILVQEQVISATPDRVTWTNDQGMIWTTSNDVITPQLSWSSHPELGRGRQTIIGNPRELFPLQEGNTVAYGVRGNSEVVPTGWRDEHRCAVLGQEDLEVSAGKFTTFHISCQRKDHSEELYYSPVAQNYVLRMRKFGNSESRKELVSVALSDDRTKDIPMAVAKPTLADKKPMAPGAKDAMVPKTAMKDGDGSMTPADKMKPTTGNARVDALIARLEAVVAGLEKMNGAAMAGKDGGAKKADDKAKSAKSAGKGGKYGAHLASYRTVAGARRGWRALTRKFKSELSGLEFGTTEFDKGDGRGTYIRLVAMSFKSKSAADRFCRKLKAKRQFCSATRARP